MALAAHVATLASDAALALRTLEGSWHRGEKLPPWCAFQRPFRGLGRSGRFGTAAVRISNASQEQVRPLPAKRGGQVVLMGGNDNQNRGDVWRWLRHPEPIELNLGDSEATGSQEQDCVGQRGRSAMWRRGLGDQSAAVTASAP